MTGTCLKACAGGIQGHAHGEKRFAPTHGSQIYVAMLTPIDLSCVQLFSLVCDMLHYLACWYLSSVVILLLLCVVPCL